MRNVALTFLVTYFIIQNEITNNSCYLNDLKSMETLENASVIKEVIL